MFHSDQCICIVTVAQASSHCVFELSLPQYPVISIIIMNFPTTMSSQQSWFLDSIQKDILQIANSAGLQN